MGPSFSKNRLGRREHPMQGQQKLQKEATKRPAGGVRVKKVDKSTGEVRIYRDGKLIKKTGGKKSQNMWYRDMSKLEPPDLSSENAGDTVLLPPQHCRNDHGSSKAFLPFAVLVDEKTKEKHIDKRCNYCRNPMKNNYESKTSPVARSTVGFGAAAAGGCC